jgi:restriction endonuclease Mrr
MVMPTCSECIVPLIEVFNKERDCAADEYRNYLAKKFNVSPQERALVNKRGFVFNNHVAFGLHYLVVHGPFITKIEEGVYRLTQLGESLKKTNPKYLSVTDLKEFSPGKAA